MMLQMRHLVFVCVLFATPWVHASDRLNILLVTADDLGVQIGCYGDHTVATPNLDALAEQSVRFEKAYVAQASCSSSRSAMLTGVYPHTSGQYGLVNANVGFAVHEEYVRASLPNVLHQNGYRTAHIGKLHVAPEQQFAFDVRDKTHFGTRKVMDQVELATQFIDECKDQPWFLMFNLFDPHVQGKRKQGAPAFPDVVDGLPAQPISADDVQPWPWHGVDTPVVRKRIAGYYNCVARLDAAIGKLVSELKQRQLFEQTLIIFLGDHGPPFARGKTFCYESGVRVPMLVRWPGDSMPHVSTRLVSAVDITPTALAAAEIQPAMKYQGASLRPLLKTPSDGKWRETLLTETHYHGASPFVPRRAITDGRWKLIANLPSLQAPVGLSVDGDPAPKQTDWLDQHPLFRSAYDRAADPPPFELYDLSQDPHELVNLVEAPSHGKDLERMKRLLSGLRMQLGDPFLKDAFVQAVVQRHRRQPK